jgi:hypothetical protein
MSNSRANRDFQDYMATGITIQQPKPQTDYRKLDAEIAEARKTPIHTVDLETDSEFRAMVNHVLNPGGERLQEFVARTGLGKATIISQKMNASDITRFCEAATERNKNDINAPSASWRPRAIPSKFILD